MKLWLLTLSWQRPLSYRNQFIDLLPKSMDSLICSPNQWTHWLAPQINGLIDLLCKSMDWFLNDNGLCHERVKQNHYKLHRYSIYYSILDENQFFVSLNFVTCVITFSKFDYWTLDVSRTAYYEITLVRLSVRPSVRH